MKLNGDKICFIIAPIGENNSEIRKRSDNIFKDIIEPATKECGYEPLRAQDISKIGYITKHIIEQLFESPLVIADLTGHNPNVFYELAIRHAVRKPVIQIINGGERIPFDIAYLRTIFIDLDNTGAGKEEIKKQINSIETGKSEMDNPISIAFDVNILQQSKDPQIHKIANLVNKMAGRTEALAYLEFDEKLAVMTGYKEKIEQAYNKSLLNRRLEGFKNNFSAISNLKNWIDINKKEELIIDYVIPIIKLSLENKNINDSKATKHLKEVIKIALEYDIEIDELKFLREKLWDVKK